MSLTELEIKQAKPKEKRYCLSDGRGLLLDIKTTGTKTWVVRCYLDGKEIRKTIGEYPKLSLKDAREIAAKTKGKVQYGETEEGVLFADIANEWIENRLKPGMSQGHIDKTVMRINNHIIPKLGKMRIEEIEPITILDICRKIESAGTIETAHRVKQIVSQIFRYAIATQRGKIDPTISLQGALKPIRKDNHYPTLIKKDEIAVLMKNISSYPQKVTRLALLFSAFTFCRPGEIRQAEWEEINWNEHEWRIPTEKMKMRRQHIVPLTLQTMGLLEELRPLTERFGKWLFPSARLDGRPMSDNTVRCALRTLGYSNDDFTAHSFRSMASTVLNENGFPPDVIERQLAHAERNTIRAAYNHAEYLPERRKMMQWWADWLDGLAGA